MKVFFMIEWWMQDQRRYAREYYSCIMRAAERYKDLEERVPGSGVTITSCGFEDA